MKGFALSSLVPEAPITSAIATALLQQLRRVEAMWVKQLTDPQSANARVWGCVAEVALEWSATIGEVAPGDFAVVQIVTALPLVRRTISLRIIPRMISAGRYASSRTLPRVVTGPATARTS